MRSSRLEAFSDGVLAIIITIMVLELKMPEGDSVSSLWHTTGVGLLSYVISFLYVGIYWNNHHHLFQVADEVDGSVLWANLALLFFLSLLPFTTTWMDEQDLAAVPVMVYGVDLFLAGAAYFVLEWRMGKIPRQAGVMQEVFGDPTKERLSMAGYVLGIIAPAVTAPWVGMVFFVAVALMWVVPDRRVERFLKARDAATHG